MRESHLFQFDLGAEIASLGKFPAIAAQSLEEPHLGVEERREFGLETSGGAQGSVVREIAAIFGAFCSRIDKWVELPSNRAIKGKEDRNSKEFVRSARVQRRYWARSYAGWQRFVAAQPGSAHKALAALEAKDRVYGMITQNVDRLHNRAGSNPIELHGTVYSVICLDCGSITGRHLFQDRVKDLNPEWALGIKSLEKCSPGSDASFGMQQRPDGDIEIDEKFWEDNFSIPTCEQCGGVLKPNVVLFGDNVPKERADRAMEMVTGGDSLLVVGSSLMTMSVYRLLSAAKGKVNSPIAIVNIGPTRADDLASIKIEARCGEMLPRLLAMGSLDVPRAS